MLWRRSGRMGNPTDAGGPPPEAKTRVMAEHPQNTVYHAYTGGHYPERRLVPRYSRWGFHCVEPAFDRADGIVKLRQDGGSPVIQDRHEPVQRLANPRSLAVERDRD